MSSNTNGSKMVPMKKIEDITKRRIAFSKRRIGLFNKANELSIRCGAEIAIIIFSLADNVFSYSHPSLHGVIEKYFLLNGFGNYEGHDHGDDDDSNFIVEEGDDGHDDSNFIVEEADDELTELENKMNMERKTRKEFLDCDGVSKDRFEYDVTKSGKMSEEKVERLKVILNGLLKVMKNDKVKMKYYLEAMKGVKGGANIDHVGSFFDPFEIGGNMANGHYQNIEPFGQSMGNFLPRESLNFNFGNINPMIGGGSSSRGIFPFDYTTDGGFNSSIQFVPNANTGAGPSGFGTNFPHGFSHDNIHGFSNTHGFGHGNMRGF